MVTEQQKSQADQKFDRVMGSLTGLPDVKQTRPSTVLDTTPIVGDTRAYIVQTFRTPDQGFLTFLQIVDGEGRARIILPHKVVEGIVRQRTKLTDRSTAESRARKARTREVARKRKEKEARKAAWAARHK